MPRQAERQGIERFPTCPPGVGRRAEYQLALARCEAAANAAGDAGVAAKRPIAVRARKWRERIGRRRGPLPDDPTTTGALPCGRRPRSCLRPAPAFVQASSRITATSGR